MSLSRRIDDIGRIVIPREFRENLGLIAGTPMKIQLVSGCIVMTPTYGNRRYVESIEELLNVMAADGEKKGLVAARQYLMRAIKELEEYNDEGDNDI